MDPWSDAKSVFMKEEANRRAETVLAYGLLKPKDITDPIPVQLQQWVVLLPRFNFNHYIRRRELNKTIPAKEVVITNIAENINLDCKKGEDIDTFEVDDLKLLTHQSPHYPNSYMKIDRTRRLLHQISVPSTSTHPSHPQGSQ